MVGRFRVAKQNLWQNNSPLEAKQGKRLPRRREARGNKFGLGCAQARRDCKTRLKAKLAENDMPASDRKL